ncbi:MFS transporter [Arthrobacter sp. Ld5]|uniref:MFS transporter n=1 Tax=Arthrobacter sp. Ld5 TaxID=649152 RepID=UPI003EBEED79
MRSLVLNGMALIAATYGLARFGYGLFLPRFVEEFQLGPAVSGFIQAGSFLSFCVAATLAFKLSARPRLVVLLAGATAAIGSAGVAAAPSAVVLAIAVVLAGAGAGFATPGLVTLIERNLDAARQENAQTVVNAGTGAGIVVAGGIMLLTITQWRIGWVAIALLVVLATVATIRSDRAGQEQQEATPSARMRARDRSVLVRPIAAAMLVGASSAAVWTFGRSAMAESGTGAEVYSVVAWMVLGAFGVLGAVAGGIIHRWTLRTAWVLSAVSMGAATIVLGAVPGVLLPAYVSVAVFGAAYTAACGVLIIWAERVVPEHAAEGTAVLFIALAIGQAIGSVLMGFLYGATSPILTFAVAGALGILALLPASKAGREASSDEEATEETTGEPADETGEPADETGGATAGAGAGSGSASGVDAGTSADRR